MYQEDVSRRCIKKLYLEDVFRGCIKRMYQKMYLEDVSKDVSRGCIKRCTRRYDFFHKSRNHKG